MANWETVRHKFLSLPKEPKEKAYYECFDRDFEDGIPYDSPPYWHFFLHRHTIPAHCQKQRMLKTLGESLYLNLDKDDFNLLNAENNNDKPPGYNSLTDPNLKIHFQQDYIKKFLKRQGLVNRHMEVAASVKDFNHYRGYLYSQLLRQINIIWHEELEKEKKKVMIMKQEIFDNQKERMKYGFKKEKRDWFKERKRQFLRKSEEDREKFFMEDTAKDNLIGFRRLQKYNHLVERLSDYFEVLEHRRLMGIYFKDAIRQNQIREQKMKQDSHIKAFNKYLKEAEGKRKTKIEIRCEKISEAKIRSHFHDEAIGEEFKKGAFERGLTHFGRISEHWDRLDNDIRHVQKINRFKKKMADDMFDKWWEIKTCRNKRLPNSDPISENINSCWDVLETIEDIENLGRMGTESVKDNYLLESMMHGEDFTINQLSRRMIKSVLERSLKWIAGEIPDIESTPFNLIKRSELNQHRTIPETVQLLVDSALRKALEISEFVQEVEEEIVEEEEDADNSEDTVKFPFDFQPC